MVVVTHNFVFLVKRLSRFSSPVVNFLLGFLIIEFRKGCVHSS